MGRHTRVPTSDVVTEGIMDEHILVLQGYVNANFKSKQNLTIQAIDITQHRMCSADQGLHHLCPPGPHFRDKLKDVQVISLLQSLHHCIKCDESASATNTSTMQKR